MPITFQFQEPTTLKDRTSLKVFLNKIFIKEGKKAGNISYVFCSDSFLLDINHRFLSHDYYTDIITFDLSSDNNKIEAEIFISIDRVKENALKFRKTFKNELYRVMIHGVLHLCGYKDKTKKEATVIRTKEDLYLKLGGFT